MARQGGAVSAPESSSTGARRLPELLYRVVDARNEEQLRQNLGAVGWSLTASQIAKLDAASATTLAYPYWHGVLRNGIRRRSSANLTVA